MTEFIKMNDLDRKELLSYVAELALRSDEYFQKLKELNTEYKDLCKSKIGREISNN